MKIVKRVSLLKGIERINDPPPASFRMDKMIWNKRSPYRLDNTQELFRFGYRNYRHKTWLVAGAILACAFGAFVDSTEKALMDVENVRLRMRIQLFIAIE